MAAPKNNQFWKLRSKHGRNKLFDTPEELWNAACEYFEWVDANPWKKKDWVGKDAIEVERELHRAYSIEGLCIFLGIAPSTFYRNRKTDDVGLCNIATRIEKIIETQQFEGACCGIFNASIVARKLGLTDKKEHSGEINIKPITGMEIL